MFRDLYDALSRLWSWRWPLADGEVTAVDVERNREKRTARLAVAYEFCVGADGPYTGECFWHPAFFQEKRVGDAKGKLRLRHPIRVRYRPDDASVNRLDAA